MQNLSRVIIFLSLFSFTLFIQAANLPKVAINEIAWMGGQSSFSDEWIELSNNTENSINLEDWTLKAADGTPEISLKGTIPAQGFFLLERSNDNTIPSISADQIYTGALANQGENLIIYDNLGNLIDSADCSSGWVAGDNKTKQTMERIGLENWQTSQNPGGTPKAKNSVIFSPESEERIEEKIDKIEPNPFPEKESETATYPVGVVITEILPSPKGPDAEEEWIEIFNQNSFEVNLSDWQITDVAGKTRAYSFPQGTIINSQGYLVFSRLITKITLNNQGDGLKLIQPDQKVIDFIKYEKAPREESFNRTEAGWMWSITLTPGSKNIIFSLAADSEFEKEQLESGTEVEEINLGSQTKKELAAIGQQNLKENSSLILFIAFGLAIFSGLIILFLKRKIERKIKNS